MDRFLLHYREGAVGITIGPVELADLSTGIKATALALLDELMADALPVEARTTAEWIEIESGGQARTLTLSDAADIRDLLHRLESLARRTSSAADRQNLALSGSTLVPDNDVGSDAETASQPSGPVSTPATPSVTMAEALAASWQELGGRLDPAKLRHELEIRLEGMPKEEWRADLHLVVVAAQEGVPARLMTAGMSRRARRRLVADLAETRHWSRDAAQRAVDLWAATVDDDARSNQ